MPEPSDWVDVDELPVRPRVTLATGLGLGFEQYKIVPEMLTGAGVGVGVGDGHIQGPRHGTCGTQLGAQVGDGQPPITVIIPLFCGGEKVFRSVSMNSKSFGNGDHVNGAEASLLLTRFQ